MKNMTIPNLAKACGGRLYDGGREVSPEAFLAAAGPLGTREITGMALDSRKIEQGNLFVAIRGEHSDGHSFIPQAFGKGALAVICEYMTPGASGPCILVKDSVSAMQNVAAFYREQIPQVCVVGITGSVGKTTAKEFTASVLSQKYSICKTEKNYNNQLGVPLTLMRIKDIHQAAVVEMGISRFQEMSRLSYMARPDICLFTNIGDCHLECLGSRDGVLKAKTEMFEHMREGGRVILNGDDDKLCAIQEVKGKPPIRFGLKEEGNDIYATSVTDHGLFGSEILLREKGGKPFPIFVPLPGRHMAYHALAAAAVGRLFGMEWEEIAEGIRSVRPLAGRSNILRAGKYTVIDDCYNANPSSMEAAFGLLGLASGRKMAILGDMYELGEEQESWHEKVGAAAVGHGIDCVLCVGEISYATYRGAIEAAERNAGTFAGRQILYYPTKKALLAALPALLLPGDTVLVKASHGMGFDEVIEFLTGN